MALKHRHRKLFCVPGDFFRWQTEGLTGILSDDGADTIEDLSTRQRPTLGVTDLLDALQEKYDLLRKKLLLEMLQSDLGRRIYVRLRCVF